MSKLFIFLENFDVSNQIKLLDENDNLLFEGEIGDVPQRISNQMSVIRGTVKNAGGVLIIKVRKS